MTDRSDAAPPAVQRLAIVGSTASGKSEVAMAVARQLGDVHIVSVDSMQVYRGMDIGTAKPTVADRTAVPHHCIDLVEPSEEFTVADFQREYRHALAQISASGGRALLVGGTGLYHRIVVDEFELPGEWPAIRDTLDADTDTAALHERLGGLDRLAASRMEPTNRRRIIRALEVTIGSGRPFSTFGPGVDAYPPTDVVQIGIRRSRHDIADRIEHRVHAMLDAGLVDEVVALREHGLSRTAAQALGYKELIEFLDGRISKDDATEMIITRTSQFAVRQERWFRRDPRVRWVDIEHDPVTEALPAVFELLSERDR